MPEIKATFFVQKEYGRNFMAYGYGHWDCETNESSPFHYTVFFEKCNNMKNNKHRY